MASTPTRKSTLERSGSLSTLIAIEARPSVCTGVPAGTPISANAPATEVELTIPLITSSFSASLATYETPSDTISPVAVLFLSKLAVSACM